MVSDSTTFASLSLCLCDDVLRSFYGSSQKICAAREISSKSRIWRFWTLYALAWLLRNSDRFLQISTDFKVLKGEVDLDLV